MTVREPNRPRSGADLLRLVVRNMDGTSEGFNDRYTAAELLKIFTAQLESAWDFSPDEWTSRQVREALAGRPPRWDDQERPLYGEE